MPAQAFAYTALDAAGARKTGVIEADTRDAAVSKLAASGRYVLEIRETAAAPAARAGGRVHFRRGIPRQELALFTRRLADLAQAGLPLDRALEVVAEQSENPNVQAIAAAAVEDVRSGLPVSQALAKFPRHFNQVYTETLRAGEASGQFGDVASRLADFQEKEVARRSQIVSALVYPGVLSATAVLVVVFLLTFVVPRLAGVFDDLGSDLPLSTRLLLASTTLVTDHAVALVGGIVVLALGLRAWLSTSAGADARDRLILRAPVVGPVIMRATISRFARVLGTLVYGGVPILEALSIAGLSAGNRVFHRSAVAVEQEVREGRPIAEAMRDAGKFPPVLVHMVAIGEETGDLPRMLGRVSDSLDFEVDTGMRRIISLVEPAVVLVMGAFVGFVVLSVLLPIYQAQDLVK